MAADSTPALLPAWAQRLIADFDEADLRAHRIAEGLGARDLNWRANPGEWSIGQCLDHLRAANAVYLSAIGEAFNDCARQHVQEITPGRFGRWFITQNSEQAAKKKRMRAPGKIVPRPDVSDQILSEFLQSNEAAREFVRRASGYDVNRIRFRNPFLPLLRLTAGTGLEVIVKHQGRHLAQAESVKAHAAFRR